MSPIVVSNVCVFAPADLFSDDGYSSHSIVIGCCEDSHDASFPMLVKGSLLQISVSV